MSRAGIEKFAQVMSVMQEARRELLAMGCGPIYGQKVDQQDILLGQLLEKAKDAVQPDFLKITTSKKKED